MPPSWQRYHHATRLPAAICLMVAPLVLLYGLGLPSASDAARSGVDIVSGSLMMGLGVDGYLWVQAAVAASLLAFAAWRLRGRTARHALLTLPVAAESALYGAVLGGLILGFMEEQHLLGPLMIEGSTLDVLVLSAGAGLHEELLFRLMALPGVAWAAERALAMPRPLALGTAAVVTSLLFAGAHHLAGEPFEAFAFTYRTLAGLAFAAVFLLRGFGVAAWSHAAYDLQVLLGVA